MAKKPQVTDLGEFYRAKGREEMRAGMIEWVEEVMKQVEQEPTGDGPDQFTEEERGGALAVLRVLREKLTS